MADTVGVIPPDLMFGQQLLHLGENHCRIFILLRPVKGSKVSEKGEQQKESVLNGTFFFLSSFRESKVSAHLACGARTDQ